MSTTDQTAAAAAYATRWTQWVARTSLLNNPLLDETGDDAGRKQPGDVWFLGGTMGGSARRDFRVPAGIPLFGPAFCMWCPGPVTVGHIEGAHGSVRLDGQEVPLVRAATDAVMIRGALLNPVTRTFWPVRRWLVGIWATIEPLDPGTHTIEIHGGDGFGFEVNVEATVHAT
ncbi:hypothetical protein [Antribacter gilvus]|uniref:hypothetical protein n=1 Tax=Antribacter gilvus TaxID=2304675 RepID=UPI000F76D230|nr:hypothetical protein [Antribacter gilvus]